ncbi:MAG TPA: hypothetical protein VLZ82_04495 [Microbacterium sp.]|nr:hypothetical protein [Microbacterium sp.]
MSAAERSTGDAAGAEVSAPPVFTAFGDAAAGFCGDVCAIPPGSMSAEAGETAMSGMSIDAR